MSNVYVSGALRQQAHAALDKARSLEAQGDAKGAAAEYRRFAAVARKLAEKEPVQLDRVRLIKKAIQAEEKAGRMDSGKLEAPGVDAGPGEASGGGEIDSAIAGLIYRSPVQWDDIAGMEQTKASLKYMMGLILAKPPEGVELECPSRILLYGPPGTGKTLLAAACSNMLGATFFNVKASNLLSKYFGESTKLISALYSRARSEADSGAAVVFMDEFDSIGAQTDGGESGPERRILATLLAELDGLAQKGAASGVITIAATNYPWILRDAVLDRFDRQILVGLPDQATRAGIFRVHLEGKGLKLSQEVSCDRLAAQTEGYSGRLIQRICKAAVLKMISESNSDIPRCVDERNIKNYQIRHRPLRASDFNDALGKIKPAVDAKVLKRFADYQAQTGGESVT